MKRISILVKSLGTAAAMLLLGMASVYAATLTVTTTADAGVGSLRQALIDATANAEANSIVFAIPTTDPGYNAGTNRFTISLTSAIPDIPLAATTITNAQPQNVTVSGNDTFPIFTLVDSAVVVITNITISRGSGLNGGGISMGDSGTLTLNDCTVSNNSAVNFGGGVYMSNSATLHTNRSSFSLNNATDGGAIFIFNSGTVNLNTSTLNGNSSSDSGGAIYIGVSGTLNASHNTFSGNSAANNGGAIANFATITLTSNTLSGNLAASGGGIVNFGAAATLNNNIVALNTAGTGTDLLGDGGVGNPYTGTYNLIGNSDGSVGLNAGTNMWGTTAGPLDPKIGPLDFNGGPTRTHALLFDSPAIDQGNDPGYSTDQRGWVRPVDNAVVANAGDGSDMGSFEHSFAPSAANVTISGRVVISQGKQAVGIANAVITASASGGVSWTARSNAFGYFSLTEIPAGATYLITVTHKRYTFDSQTMNVVDGIERLTFVAN